MLSKYLYILCLSFYVCGAIAMEPVIIEQPVSEPKKAKLTTGQAIAIGISIPIGVVVVLGIISACASAFHQKKYDARRRDLKETAPWEAYAYDHELDFIRTYEPLLKTLPSYEQEEIYKQARSACASELNQLKLIKQTNGMVDNEELPVLLHSSFGFGSVKLQRKYRYCINKALESRFFKYVDVPSILKESFFLLVKAPDLFKEYKAFADEYGDVYHECTVEQKAALLKQACDNIVDQVVRNVTAEHGMRSDTYNQDLQIAVKHSLDQLQAKTNDFKAVEAFSIDGAKLSKWGLLEQSKGVILQLLLKEWMSVVGNAMRTKRNAIAGALA